MYRIGLSLALGLFFLSSSADAQLLGRFGNRGNDACCAAAPACKVTTCTTKTVCRTSFVRPRANCCPAPAPSCCPAPAPVCCPAPAPAPVCCPAPAPVCCPPPVTCCKPAPVCCPAPRCKPAPVCCPAPQRERCRLFRGFNRNRCC